MTFNKDLLLHLKDHTFSDKALRTPKSKFIDTERLAASSEDSSSFVSEKGVKRNVTE
jgi:hypothetical protein